MGVPSFFKGALIFLITKSLGGGGENFGNLGRKVYSTGDSPYSQSQSDASVSEKADTEVPTAAASILILAKSWLRKALDFIRSMASGSFKKWTQMR